MSPDRTQPRRALQQPPSPHAGAWRRIDTRLGSFLVAALDGAIVQTALPGSPEEKFTADLAHRFPLARFTADPDHPLLSAAATQLEEYADGQRTSFQVPLRAEGTEFQQRVWDALARIPYGEVWSYQDVARAIGRPGASRAVGQANHHNPVAPFIPCHRVVTSSGLLGGYGGGMDLKRTLLHHEGAQIR